MRRSTTSAVTERRVLGLLLAVELAVGLVLLTRGQPAPPPRVVAPVEASAHTTLSDGRVADVIPMGGPDTVELANRIRAELDDAAAAVTAFWGDDWRRDITIVATGSAMQVALLAGGGRDVSPDIAALTTPERIVFAPGAAHVSPASLRILVRHELFHYAARDRTAADAPQWLTEGVADYVGRPPTARPGPGIAAELARVPTDADLATEGTVRSASYDRAWWFARYVAETRGPDALRRLYLAACAPGHTDVASAVRAELGMTMSGLLVGWRQWLTG